MPKYTQEQLREKYNKLPEELKDAIFSEDVARAIRNISQKYKLPIDKTGELASEVGDVFLGITHPRDFTGNLAQRLRTDQLTTRNIAEDVNKEIFSPVRESLKKLHSEKEEEDAPKIPEKEPAAPGMTEHPAPITPAAPPKTAFSDVLPPRTFPSAPTPSAPITPPSPAPSKTPPSVVSAPSVPAQTGPSTSPQTQKPTGKIFIPPPAPPLPSSQKEGAFSQEPPIPAIPPLPEGGHEPVATRPAQKPLTPPPAQTPHFPAMQKAPPGVLPQPPKPDEIVRAESKISEHKLPLSPEEQKNVKRKAFEQLFAKHEADSPEQEANRPAEAQKHSYGGIDPYKEPVE